MKTLNQDLKKILKITVLGALTISATIASVGGDNKDYIWGNRGNDYIAGRGDKDIIFGNRGNDLIDGGSGNDIIFGNRDVMVQ